MKLFAVIIIGASASGLMCAIEAAKRGRKVIVLDHAEKAAKKIRISGGGRCNFTNYDVSADNYISNNPHFCKSALSRYQYYDFLALLSEYHIPWHEREHGQLFCDQSANDIVQMLLSECQRYEVLIQLNCHLQSIKKVHKDSADNVFLLGSSMGDYRCDSLVIATGGLSVAKMGASDFGLRLARQFKLNIISTQPGLVPLSYSSKDSKKFKQLSGIAVKCEISFSEQKFTENLLFTHKGISGPAVLQISSYWISQRQQNFDSIKINLLPDINLYEWLSAQQSEQANTMLKNILSNLFPKRLVECFCHQHEINQPIKRYNNETLRIVSELFQNWRFRPDGTEGYRVAEVTLGGVDTSELSSRTMQAGKVPGLYFIGEVVDVTGQLGGYNFQWAWSSGFAAGQFV